MSLCIPAERCHALARAHAKPVENMRDSHAALAQVTIADTLPRAGTRGGHDFTVGVPFRGVIEKSVQCQGEGLHPSVHHWHPGTPAGRGGARMPAFQFHAIPAARRRQTTCS